MERVWIRGLFVIVVAVLLIGCGQSATEETAVEPEPQAETAAAEPQVADEPALPMVEVAAEGTEFDPPVEVSQLPDGVWYCDMGTVHYARAEEGDGTCPLCEMKLVKKVAAAAGTPVPETTTDEPADAGHEGHEHAEG